MTTTAHEDQFTPGTQTIERVRAPYDTASILRRNVAELELALKRQTERAEAAEAEMTKARKQKPIKYLYRVTDCFGHDVLRDDPKGATILETIPLFAAPIPAPAVSAANPVQWLEDEGDMILVPRGLLGAACSSIDKQRPAPKVLEAMRHYTMNAPQAPAVPQNELVAAITVYLKADDEMHQATRRTGFGGMGKQVASEAEQRRLAAIRHAARGDLEALLQSAPQAPAVPELDPMTRLIVSDPKQIKPKKQKPAVPEFCAVEAQLTLAETEMLNAKAWSPGTQAKRHIDFAMTAICCASALLQSAEVTK